MSNVYKFQFRQQYRGCDNFGAVDYTVTETIAVHPDGLLVESRALGHCEGARVDVRETKFWPGADIERAIAYRLSHGYTRLA